MLFEQRCRRSSRSSIASCTKHLKHQREALLGIFLKPPKQGGKSVMVGPAQQPRSAMFLSQKATGTTTTARVSCAHAPSVVFPRRLQYPLMNSLRDERAQPVHSINTNIAAIGAPPLDGWRPSAPPPHAAHDMVEPSHAFFPNSRVQCLRGLPSAEALVPSQPRNLVALPLLPK